MNPDIVSSIIKYKKSIDSRSLNSHIDLEVAPFNKDFINLNV